MKCPKCGFNVASPVKTWALATRKPSEAEGRARLVVGIFECPKCKARFRSAIEAEAKVEETVSIKNMVERIKSIKGELVQTLKNLREKIKTLETERVNLMIEIEKLRKVAEARVSALESEVNMLREEVTSLRDLLGYSEEKEK
jgi:septal ring factor EnvC (AmiA/AmiB activator)